MGQHLLVLLLFEAQNVCMYVYVFVYKELLPEVTNMT
jgi:hypothetical protein